jgi:uncharacterized protein YqeY
MGLTEKINDQIKAAMRAREKEKLEALRAIKSALLLESTKGGEKGISEAVEMQILTRLHKQRKESADIYKQQGRPELAAEEIFQAEVIEAFLPAQMDEAEVDSAIAAIIADTGAAGMQDMGKVMGRATAEMAGRADAKLIAAKVRQKLSQG